MELIQILKDSISLNKQIITKAEKTINEYKIKDRDKFLIEIGECCNHQDQLIRKASIKHFHKFFYSRDQQYVQSTWISIKKETQEFVKSQIILILLQETNNQLRQSIKKMFIDLMTYLWNDNKDLWPNLRVDVWQLFLSHQDQVIIIAYEILALMIEFNVDAFQICQQDLFLLFQKGLMNNNSEINEKCLKTFAKYIQQEEISLLEQYKLLIPTMITSFLTLAQNKQYVNNIDETIESLQSAVEEQPKLFIQHFNIMINGINQLLLNNEVLNSIKQDSVSILVTFAQRTPTIFKKTPYYTDKLIEMIYFLMIQISPLIDQKWLRPEEGYNDNFEFDQDLAIIKFGQNSIDILLESLGYQYVLPYISTKSQYFLQQDDWRILYSALMSIAQIGEYAELNQVKPFIEQNLQLFHHSNPKIRYAIIYMIGQLADDMKPQFQQELTTKIMVEVIQRFQYENVDRVKAYLMAMLTNLWESTEISEEYFVNIFEYCLNQYQIGISLCKETAISCIGTISGTTTKYIEGKVHEFIPFLLESIKTYQSNQIYEELTGQSIECLTMIIYNCQLTTISSYIEQTIQLLLGIKILPFKDNLKITSYILQGWQRLMSRAEYLKPHYLSICQNTIQIIQSIIRDVENYNEEESNQSEGDIIQAIVEDSLQFSMALIVAFNEKFGQLFMVFVQNCLGIIFKIFNNDYFKVVQEKASQLLIAIIKNLKQNTAMQFEETAKQNYIFYFLNQIYDLDDAQKVELYINIISNIIDLIDMDFLTQDEVVKFITLFITTYQSSDERILSNQNSEEAEQTNESEESLQVKAIGLIKVLLKTHNLKTLNCLNQLALIKLPAMNKNYELPTYQKKFTLNLINIFIEYFGQSILGNQFHQFMDALIFYAQDLDSEIRQIAFYGIGQAAKIQKDVYLTFGNSQIIAIQLGLETLWNVTGKKDQRESCRENIYAALGKIIYYQSESLGEQYEQMVSQWLENLPLRYDKDESEIQNELLTQMIFNQLSNLINSSLEIAQQIFYILSENLFKKDIDDTLKQKISQILQKLIQFQFIQKHQNNILDKIKNEKKIQMKNLLNI